MEIKELLQKDAHVILESLRDKPDFEKAFVVEADRKTAGENIWALPPQSPESLDLSKTRKYYMVILDDGQEYLFIALNGHLNISSIWRVATNRIEGMTLQCFKHFFQEKILPLCKDSNRLYVYATASTDNGLRFFRKLKLDPPVGVHTIEEDALGKMQIAVRLR